MRNRTAVLVAAAGVALLAPASYPAAAQQHPPETAAAAPGGAGGSPVAEALGPAAAVGPAEAVGPAAAVRRPAGVRSAREGAARRGSAREGSVRAADLLARTRSCAQISRGKYRTDDGAPADVPVCGARGVVFWKADMDIDCDGQPTKACNRRTDPLFFHATAFQQSDGRQLNAERLPYVVVPGAGRRWNHARHGITGGTVAAVVHRGRVQYAVVGDTGPEELIGEASYATARALGIRPDPRTGGAPSDVTYIFFKGSKASPIESHRAAVDRGDALARAFVRGD
ncbi:glycoside hydrolase family 75 protein [Streptomyces sp. NPDC002564]|uniref:glycoside hydrolase family 75 protein n=1 Tax=Streptomyces sp. NPDC002564 TaxID=3364649 RepID=UPI0036AC65EC